MAVDLFQRIHPDEKSHPQFVGLRDSPYFAPARAVIQEIQAEFDDPDGNFVEQFQTFGFDARTFELFVFALLREAGHLIDRSNASPDFMIERDGSRAGIEVVTANPSATDDFQPYSHFPPFETKEELDNYKRHDLAIRVGSPLYSKLKREYWKLPHLVGLPLIIGIQDFHGQGSLMLTDTALSQYLYGLEQEWYRDEKGTLIISEKPLDFHQVGAKKIPSGFFRQPDAENISGVLFSNSGTIPKFNRIGHEGRHRSDVLRMLRFGTCYRHDPNSTVPMPFLYEVGDPEWPPETWRQGTVLFHNPNARVPLPRGWFGASLEMELKDGKPVATFAEPFLPYWSVTMKFPAETPQELIQQQADQIAKALSDDFPP